MEALPGGLDMTDLRDKFIESVQTVLATQRGDSGGAAVAESLAMLSGLARQMLSEGLDPLQAESAAADLRALCEADPATLDPAQFQDVLIRLEKNLRAQDAEMDALSNELAEDPELIQEFLVESREHLANVETGLLTLERETNNRDAIHAVFRSFHTIKGLAAFLGAHSIQELAHETESVLDLVRSGSLVLHAELTDLILQSADTLSRMLNQIGELSLGALPRASRTLLSNLARYTRPQAQQQPANQAPAQVKAKAQANAPAATPVTVEQVVAENVLPKDLVEAAPVALEVVVEPSVEPAPAADAAKKGTESGVVRIDTAKLEYLIDMVGELVIAESVVRNDAGIITGQDPVLSRNLAQLARVVEEVQKTSMSMRMVPVGVLFRKMTRLVRDLSRKSGKQVDLVTMGDDVELDRTIVEELADPMVHMIRNAVDHGLETRAERLAAGKSEAGTVTLKALHDAGDIVIEISDNGRGLDKERILAKARRVGLIAPDQTPDEADIFRLIFEPGFSTAAKVTDLSGRGVGMDVVKKHIQRLRGRIDIRSVLGQGCTFTLRLPLTLAIIDGLVVGVGSQRYILPMFAVREMFSPVDGTFVTIENRAEAALFRDKLLPLVRLSNLFGVSSGSSNPGILIVAEARDQIFCIAVDQLIGKQEVVIKNLGKTFRDVPAIAGGAILGDGRVGLILDVNALR